MDAKPQRIRVRGDENASAVGPLPNKTVHSRNKSTSALSAAAQAGIGKQGIRRAAFGDVSNTTNPVRQNRAGTTNASLVGLGQCKAIEKLPAWAPPETGASILSHPAQRSVQVTGLKKILTSAKPVEPVTKQQTGGLPQNAPIARKSLKKPVFKDSILPLTETADNKPEDSVSAVAKLDKDDGSSLPPVTAPSTITDAQPISDVEEESADDSCGAAKSSGPVSASVERVALKNFVSTIAVQDSEASLPKLSEESTSASAIEYAHATSEPEEYWEEEEEDDDGGDEENDDDGYTTARSYRSRGDNTTGGATTVLFPKFTSQAKREIAEAQEIVEATRSAEDIEDDYWDTSMVAEYSEEIFSYMKEQEIRLLPNAHYMDNQTEIQWSMRSVLMDWLVEVHLRFSLLPETLFLCVNFVDRFLSCKIVSLGKLQLVGATAIFIAAKYEEIHCPSVKEVVYMVGEDYSVSEILKAEQFMLNMLQYELGWPGPMSFLRRISKADDYDLETRTLAKYFLEITIMDERFVGSPPSFTAAGAHCLARLMLRKGDWSPAHVYYSEYTYSQLLPMITLIYECCENPEKHHSAVFSKYQDRRFKRASLFVQAELKKGFKLP